MLSIFHSHDSTTNRFRKLVVNSILYDVILTHTIVDPFKIIIVIVGPLLQVFTFGNIHINAVANDKTK